MSMITCSNANDVRLKVRLKPLAVMMSLALGAVFSMHTLAAVERISTNSTDGQSDNQSNYSDMSGDGNWVAFTSDATNLVEGDTNKVTDIFVKNLLSREIKRVSTDSIGNQSNGYSAFPVLSIDGSWVAFQSGANNLVDGDSNAVSDIFVKNVSTGEIRLVSTNSAKAQGNKKSSLPRLSADGTKVAFISDANNLVDGDSNNYADIFVKDLLSEVTTRVSTDNTDRQGNGESYELDISANGDRVAFVSTSGNLVEGDTDGEADLFVKDLSDGTITLIADGGHSPSLSADGNFVAFHSDAINLVKGDTNGQTDIFVKNLLTGEVRLASIDSAAWQGDGPSYNPSLSADGSRVTFESLSTNLVLSDTNGDRDIFVKDLGTGVLTRVSVNGVGEQGNDHSALPSFSADGTKVVFESISTNLVGNDTNNVSDIFVKNLSEPNLSVMAGPQVPNCTQLKCTLTLPFTVVNSGTVDINNANLLAAVYLSADACESVGFMDVMSIPTTLVEGASQLWSFNISGSAANLRGKYACVVIDAENILNEDNEVDNWTSWKIKLR